MEKDDEVSGEGNSYTTEFRQYDTRIARWKSLDPMTFESWSPYNAFDGNPIYFSDPSGAAVEGDYYGANGKWLGTDGEADDKVYRAESVTKNDDGIVTKALNGIDLGITHTEFRIQAATVYGESTAYALNNVTEELKKEMFGIASVYQNNSEAYGGGSDKGKEYAAMTPEKINSSEFKTTANAAVINALTGGFDYSYGATNWDGAEQSEYPASNDDHSDPTRGNGGFELHMNTMGWTISDEHYAMWKKNVGDSFQAPQHHPAPKNYTYYNSKGKKVTYKNIGKMSYTSTAVHGGTIFWTTNGVTGTPTTTKPKTDGTMLLQPSYMKNKNSTPMIIKP
jgi:RHS repeat-associated protein